MPFSNRLQQLYFICLCIVAFTIPFPYIFNAAAVFLLIVAWLLTVNIKTAFRQLKERKLLWIPIILFLLHAISYTYSSDKDQSALDLSKKVSFFILPIVIGLGPEINRKRLEQLFGSFVIGLSIIAIYCLANAGIVWGKEHSTLQFFYHDLVKGLDANAIYYALYTVFSLSLLLLFNWEGLLRRKSLFLSLVILQLVFFLLLSSKTLILFFILIVLPFYLKKISRKKLLIPGISVITLLIISICLIVLTDNPIRVRYQSILHNNENEIWQSNNPSGKHFNNLTLRLFIWKTAWQNIEEHNLYWRGCGNGDVQLYQKRKLQIYDHEIDTRYNPYIWTFNLHNQFLQMFMMLGVPGLIVFIFLIFIPFFYFNKVPEKRVFLLFHLSFLFMILQESALQTQAGIIYYFFFAQIFWNTYYNNKHSQIA